MAPSSFEAVVQRVPFEYVEVQENREDQERHHQQEENQEPVSQRVIYLSGTAVDAAASS